MSDTLKTYTIIVHLNNIFMFHVKYQFFREPKKAEKKDKIQIDR